LHYLTTESIQYVLENIVEFLQLVWPAGVTIPVLVDQ